MNFRKEYKGQLILENVWGTPGEQGTGVWKKTLSPRDFNIVQERGLEEVVMYFSFEEFVLNREFYPSRTSVNPTDSYPSPTRTLGLCPSAKE